MNLEHIYQEYVKKDIYPFHMPGHKRNTDLMQMSNPYGIDFTEIDDLDDLHEASAHMERDGILSNAMRRASRLFGSKHSIYLINGSSGGLVCSILACTRRGDEILIPRNCHKSVYNALALAGLKPIYIYPSVDEAYGIYANLRPEDVEKALQAHPGIKLAVLVSPTFDGIVSDVAAIAETVHTYGIPLLVDEAHGPHLGPHRFLTTSCSLWAISSSAFIASVAQRKKPLTNLASQKTPINGWSSLCRETTVPTSICWISLIAPLLNGERSMKNCLPTNQVMIG